MEGMQARMQAVSTWLTSGARPVAALLAGGLGTWAGVRPTLIGGTFLLVVPGAVLACSPLRGLRQMPDPPPAPAGQTEPDLPSLGQARTGDSCPDPSLDGGAA
ncbi:hypothetical protein [Streptomyces himastatinicus]|uniref:hypothetical protein n=1 Tax=Streptomyces himastatinicus TaxID=998084 RepID=UPI001FE1835A|nr:hypothetical protein [Streptomyces himastatinicus]